MPVQRRSLPKIKKGDVIEITFLDHVATTGGVAEPILCRVIGEVIGEDKQAYYTASWLTVDNDTHNLDSHTILKSAIKSIRKYKKS